MKKRGANRSHMKWIRLEEVHALAIFVPIRVHDGDRFGFDDVGGIGFGVEAEFAGIMRARALRTEQ